ncbi:glycosyltransferase [Tautonia sp. JC769]|uniref:glycosyltransferase n=1 Tax=Tautonia sp. JC769 TaxID=3232135 RepID=UPI00345AC284
MSDQVPSRKVSEITADPGQHSTLEPASTLIMNRSDEVIDRLETQITRELETFRSRQASTIVAEEARKGERDQCIRRLRERLIERKLYATWLESEVEARNQRIDELFESTRKASEDLRRAESELAALRSFPMRAVLSRARERSGRVALAVQEMLRSPGALARSTWQRLGLGRPLNAVEDLGGLQGSQEKLGEGEGPAQECLESTRDRNEILKWIPPRRDPYEVFLQNQEISDEERIDQLRSMNDRPTFSVLVVRGHAVPRHYRETVASLRSQIYTDREVIFIDGPGSRRAMTDECHSRDEDEQDELDALRKAAGQASGDYLVFVNQDVVLQHDALLEFASAIVNAPESPDLVFGDEDRIDADGNRFHPRFRPSWSPELLLAYQAVGGTLAVRRSVFQAIGGIRTEYGQAWTYDLVLRIAEHTDRVARVARVVGSVFADQRESEPFDPSSVEMIRQSARALADAVGRRGIAARVAQPAWASRLRVPAFELDFPEHGPGVAIVIPTRDRADLLRRCLESIRARTTYQNYEIVVIDNGSQEDETLEYLDRLGPGCRVIRIENDERGFSYARIHNQAIQQLGDSFEFVVLLNNDTEVVRPEWLSQLVGYGQIAGVGAVGGRLLYPDGRLQHAGIVTDLFGGGPGHPFKGLPWWHADGQFLDRVARNVSAVTAACLLVRRETYLKIGGFDEDRFAVGFNDVDFCLRLSEMGLRCVYAPRAELLHFEGASRGLTLDLDEQQRFQERWGRRSDPYFHPAWSRDEHRPRISTRYQGAPVPIKHQPVRVLVDLDRLDGRGSSRFVTNLVEGYRHETRIVPEVCCRVDGPMGTILRRSGISVSVVPIEPGLSVADRIQSLADHFDRSECDLIHAVGVDQFPTLHAARLARIPSLWSIRDAVDFRDAFLSLDDNSAKAAIEAFSTASRVVFPARQIRNLFAPVESCWNFEVIHEAGPMPSGWPDRGDIVEDARHHLPGSARVVTCLYGEDRDQVGAILDACSTLVRSVNEVDVQIIGIPEVGSWLRDHEPFARLGPRARFVSMFDDTELKQALARTDVFVNVAGRDLSPEVSSIAEGLRKPLIQSDVDGMDESMGQAAHVFMFDPRDQDSLRSRIEAILKTPEHHRVWGRMASPARYQDMVRQYERLTLEALRSHANQSSDHARAARDVA